LGWTWRLVCVFSRAQDLVLAVARSVSAAENQHSSPNFAAWEAALAQDLSKVIDIESPD
jgi:hypothetical protein